MKPLLGFLLFLAIVAPGANAAQIVPNGTSRVFAAVNEKIDIDGIDDVRVDADVAVLDIGIYLDHPGLDARSAADCLGATAPSYACVAGPGDGDLVAGGHGTLVSERIAEIDDASGGVGVAPGARLWSVNSADQGIVDGLAEGQAKWLKKEPWTPVPLPLEPMIAGARWVADHAAEIEVMYVAAGCTTDQTPDVPQLVCIDDEGQVEALEEAVQEAIEAGVVVVLPAGNFRREVSGPASDYVPARMPDAITVSAIFDSDGMPGGKGAPGTPCNPFFSESEVDDTNADTSHYGAGIDVASPGPCTSAAAPRVAGAAAILASMDNPQDGEDVAAIASAIFGDSDCANPKAIGAGNCGWEDKSGDGVKEPLLDLHDEEVFDPETVPGDAWLIKPVPHPENTKDNRLTDVSCTSSSFCFATGNLISEGSSWGYGRVWDGSTWTSAKGVPENQGVEVTDVSCTSSTSCTAVGHKTEGGKVVTYAARWSGGTSWTRQEVPNPPGSTNSRLTGVSCTSTTFCVAVGHLDDGKIWAFGRIWNGSSWTTMGGIPPGDNEGIELNGVSCTSSTSCTAVGHEIESNGVFNFAARWDGTKWARQTTPNSGLGNDNRLTDVSCTSSSFCFATANVVDGKKVNTGYGGVWNGSSWTSAGAAPEAEGTVLNGVSCTSSTSCTAVGHKTEGGKVVSYAARWSGGTSWTREELQGAAGATDSRLSGVSCATKCVAVGNYTDAGGVWNLAEHAP